MSALGQRAEFCMYGHEMTPDNEIWDKRASRGGRPERRCKECARRIKREWARKKAAERRRAGISPGNG